jgi:heptaprenylglyceryl phosphate synthase
MAAVQTPIAAKFWTVWSPTGVRSTNTYSSKAEAVTAASALALGGGIYYIQEAVAYVRAGTPPIDTGDVVAG